MREVSTPPREIESLKDWLSVLGCGILMGMADIVPGVSGGTVTFILGYYENLIESIKSLNATAIKAILTLRFNLFFKTVKWKFLSALLLGISFSLVNLAHFFNYALGNETYRTLLYALFFGLIIAASILCILRIRQWRLSTLALLFAGLLSAFFLTNPQLKSVSKEPLYFVKILPPSIAPLEVAKVQNYDPGTQMLSNISESMLEAMLAKGVVSGNDFVYRSDTKEEGMVKQFVSSNGMRIIDWWIVLCGAIGICAMLLPGISGSYLLTILGAYPVVIGALADFTSGVKHWKFDVDAFYILLSIGLGIIIGALTFSRAVSWLLRHYHDAAMAFLAGSMVGALRTIWPFYTYLYTLHPLRLDKGIFLQTEAPFLPNLTTPLFIQAFSLTLLGLTIVFLIHFIAHHKLHKTP